MAELNAELLETIKKGNERAAQLNTERTKSIGKHEADSLAYSKGLMTYQKKYGVQLDDSNLLEEYEKVCAQAMEDSKKQLETIALIETGEYMNAGAKEEAVAPVEQKPAFATAPVTTATQVAPVVNIGQTTPVTPVTPVIPADQGIVIPEDAPVQFTPNPSTAQPAVPSFLGILSNVATAEPANTPVVAETVAPSIAPVNPIAPVLNLGNLDGKQSEQQQDVSEESFTPAGWNTQTATVETIENKFAGLGLGGINLGQNNN